MGVLIILILVIILCVCMSINHIVHFILFLFLTFGCIAWLAGSQFLDQGMEHMPPAVEVQSLTTGLPGKSPVVHFKYIQLYLAIIPQYSFFKQTRNHPYFNLKKRVNWKYQGNVQIQCNLYQITNGIFHRTRTKLRSWYPVHHFMANRWGNSG